MPSISLVARADAHQRRGHGGDLGLKGIVGLGMAQPQRLRCLAGDELVEAPRPNSSSAPAITTDARSSSRSHNSSPDHALGRGLSGVLFADALIEPFQNAFIPVTYVALLKPAGIRVLAGRTVSQRHNRELFYRCYGILYLLHVGCL
jgi:hypothetical protein